MAEGIGWGGIIAQTQRSLESKSRYHESPLRPERFVTQKIVRSACRIAQGKQKKLQLGFEIQRDWGWAPKYVEAMYRMLQQEEPEDFVIATGQTRKLQDFIEIAFEAVGLDWREHTTIDGTLFRPTEILIGRGDASKAAQKLRWQPKFKMAEYLRHGYGLQKAPP
jgi:GDPmannose 4,6-dehydratase